MSAVPKVAQYRELLLGCGMGDRAKKIITFDEIPAEWQNVTTLDIMPEHKPDVVHDLEVLPYPFEDGEFNEVHAYEVLEHTGRQGDWRFFFAQWMEFYRILKPGGYFVGSCPMWDQAWAWGDPGHSRIISANSLMFLDQDFYRTQVGKTAASDYRPVYSGDFKTLAVQEKGPQFFFALQKA